MFQQLQKQTRACSHDYVQHAHDDNNLVLFMHVVVPVIISLLFQIYYLTILYQHHDLYNHVPLWNSRKKIDKESRPFLELWTFFPFGCSGLKKSVYSVVVVVVTKLA